MLREDLETPSNGFIQSVEQSIEDEVQQGTNTIEKGHRFLKWVITRLFDISPVEMEGQITDGANDMGIDAWAKVENQSEGENKGQIQIFQLKYGKSYDIKKEILKFKHDINNFLKMKTSDIQRDDLKDLHLTIKKEELEVELFFITNQKIDYKDKTIKVFGFEQIVNSLWNEITGLPKGKRENLHLENLITYGKDAIIGVVSLQELVKFIDKTKSFIFESNIRKYLKRTKVNTGLIETLENNADKVFYYNNGITIVVKDFKISDTDRRIELIEPQIVNGAQTSSIIVEKLPYYTNVKGSIQLTIIKESNKTTREDITRFRNSQNAVKGKDLISLKHFHTRIRGQFENYGFFYETQAGSWLNMTKSEQNSYNGHRVYNNYLTQDHKKLVTAKDAIQAMVAGIFQNPTKPYSSIASFMPNGKYYDQIFDDKLKEDYRLLLYPYLIKCYSETLGYGNQDADPEGKRYARLLFVATYFKILFKEILNIDIEKIKDDPTILDKVFNNFEVNKEFLLLVDEALTYYFIHATSYIEEQKIPTWHNFFSKYAWDPLMQRTIEGFMKTNQRALEEIKQKFFAHKQL